MVLRKTSSFFLLLFLVLTGCEKQQIIPSPDKQPEADSAVEYYQYGLAQMDIVTENAAKVNSRDEYVPCTVRIDGKGVFADLEAKGAIRGRGNSTWRWYAKKPYRIKLDESAAVLGLAQNRDWVLLADYRDITHLMNNVGFTLAHELGLPYANHSRYAAVRLNGKNIGLYMVTEQVEEGGNRVRLDADEGILLALDINDGPDDEPDATNNFWSEVFDMAAAVKYPRDAERAERNWVKSEFAELEEAIDGRDWDAIQKLLDVESMIHYIMIQEIIGNVEMDNNPSLRSGYIHRYDDASKWVMGPLWDCDGGFNYNWGDMYDNRGWGHTYFENYKTLIFGTDPYHHRGAYGSTASDFFCRLFGIPEFVLQFQDRWAEVHSDLLNTLLDHLDATEEIIADAAQADMDLWGIDNYEHEEEYEALVAWLVNRFDYLNTVIPKYPKSVK